MIDEALRRGAMQKPEELERLIAMLADVELATVVEIGTAIGGTLWLWSAIAAPAAVIISVDLETGHDAEIAEYGWGTQRLELVRGDSHDQATIDRVRELVAGRLVDLLFVDGDHSYAGVRGDYETYGPLVGPGGRVVFHDVRDHGPASPCKVARFWAELREAGETEAEIIAGPDPWGGYGVIRR